MLSLRTGEVRKITEKTDKILFLKAETTDGVVDAVAYTAITPELEEGDMVLLNTTATELELGSGGYCFVLGRLFKPVPIRREEGHLMKLRYTPLQFAAKCVEESEAGKALSGKTSLEGKVCVVAELVSQVPPLAWALRHLSPSARLVYIMTESACLSLPFVKVIRDCKKKGWIHSTITYGQAFGGDLECVNIFTALLSAVFIQKADCVLISQGTGGVGMNSQFGFSALDLLAVLEAIVFLQGTPVFVPRLSFAEKRMRHHGISHHTHTILNTLPTPVYVPYPDLSEEQKKMFLEKVKQQPWSATHFLEQRETVELWERWLKEDWGVTTMGRGSRDDPVFFKASLAAARLCKDFME